MAEQKKPEAKEKPAYASAAASGDPAVQSLLAQREIHRSNGDDAKVRQVTAELAELGFE